MTLPCDCAGTLGAATEGLVPQALAATAARVPDVVAVAGDGVGEGVTYADLAGRVRALAVRLAAGGVTPGSRVALCLPRGIDLVTATLAVWEAGGVLVPLDPDSPPLRLQGMAADAGAGVGVTVPHLAGRLGWGEAVPAASPGPDGAGPVVHRIPGTAGVAGAVADRSGTTVGPGDPAYVMFTSGSTGRPKGVLVTHGALANRLHWAQARYRLGPQDAVLHKTPVSFDPWLWEVLWPLLAGSRVVLAAPRGHRDPDYLGRAIEEQAVTVAHFVPSMLDAFLSGTARRCPSLRLVIASGEVLTGRTVQRFHHRFQASLENLYGPTEAAIDVTAWSCPRDADPHLPVPIGTPITGTRAHVLDADLCPVPPGTAGELFLAGPGVALGYVGRPDLTAECFLPDPFAPYPGGRLYRTGDVCRHGPDGVLEFLGRIDEQVKIRGVRVEPEEVRRTLLDHVAVGQAAVLVGNDARGRPALVARVVPVRPEAPPAVHDLREHLARTLPSAMVPTDLVVVPDLPLTTNGKVDREALLRAGAPPPVSLGHPRRAPRDSTAEVVAGIWADVLRRPPRSGEDNFFELGGHSLDAVEVVAAVTRRLRVQVPVGALFEEPTLTGFARAVSLAPPVRSVDALQPSTSPGPFPLSFAQRRLWFLHRFGPSSPEYNVPITVRLSGRLVVADLQAALRDLVVRHAVLRTVYPAGDSEPQQVVPEPLGPIPLPVEDVCAAELHDAVTTEILRPFDLLRGPVLRARLFRVTGEDSVLALTAHHIAVDAVAVEVIRRELATLYSAARCGTAPDLPVLSLSYADYAVWQRRAAVAAGSGDSRRYWATRLRQVPTLDLPLDRPRPRLLDPRGATYGFRWDSTLTSGVRALAERCGATVNMIGLAALALLLSRHDDQPDLTLGSPSVVRPDPALDGVVGCFLAMLPLRIDLSGDPTFSELVRRVRGTVGAALEHADTPFDVVVDDAVKQRDTSTTPVFQVVYSHQLGSATTPAYDGLTVVPFAPRQRTATYDLSLALVETPAAVSGVWEYRVALFDPASIRQLHQRYLHVLRQVVRHPDVRRSAVSPIPPAENRQLAGWNSTAVSWGPAGPGGEGACLHELFEAQAARTPHAPAVVFADEVLDYQQLDRRADAVAAELRARGAGAGHVVGICLDRCPDLIVAVLGVLKSGAAFLPLEPDHPTDHLTRLIDGAGARAVLTLDRLAARLAGAGGPVIRLDGDLGRASPANSPAASSGTGPSGLAARRSARDVDVAYVLHTSGSTGEPKAVVVEHRGVVNRLRWGQRRHPLTAADAVLLTAPFTFDISVSEYLWPLLAGARVVLAPPGEQRSPELLAATMRRHRVSVVDLVSGAVDGFVEYALARDGGLPDLRLVLTGAETLASATVARFRAVAPHVELMNLYGATETSIDSLFWRCGPDDAAGAAVPIGRPIANTTVYILDDRLDPVPRGMAGEIYVGGTGVARGYLNQPAWTAERFIPDPFAESPGARLYRTGDLGRYRCDGAVEFLGRRDDQVKIRGNRIEPGEVEAAILARPGVRRAAVVARDDGTGGRRLVAYVEPQDARQLVDPARLRAELTQVLPDFLVPAVTVVLPALPLTVGGKVDRRALPPPPATRGDAAFAPARTPAEETLAAIWAQLLGLGHVGVHDDFFELGGDSITAIQVVSRARDAGLGLDPAQLFACPTVAQLAAVAGTGANVEPDQEPVSGEVPLTPVQRLLLDAEDSTPEGHYQCFAVLLPDHTAPSAAAAALELILRHHDQLRAAFHRDAGGWRCVVAAPGPPPLLDIVDKGPAPPPEGLVEALRPTAAEAAAGLRLTGPVLRATLVRFDGGPSYLVVAVSHLVVDLVSWDVIAADLRRAAAAVAAEQKPVLPARTTSYRRWAQRLEDYARSAALLPEAAHWLRQRPAPALPVDAQGGNREESARTVTTALGARESHALLDGTLTRWHGAALLDALLVAISGALTDWTGAASARVDVEGHGRSPGFADVDLSRTVGWFTTIHPLYLPKPTGDPVVDLRAVRRAREAVPRDGLPYLVAAMSTDASLRSGLAAEGPADVLLNHVGARRHADGDQATSVPLLFGRAGERSHLLEIGTEVRAGRLLLHVRYSPGRHRRATVEGLAQAVVIRLASLVAGTLTMQQAGQVRPARYPAARLSQAELERLVTREQPAEDVYPLTPVQAGLLFHSLYEDEGTAYVEQSSFALVGDLEVAALERAIAGIVRDHPALRTSLAWRGLSEPHQLVHADVGRVLRVIDLGPRAGDSDIAGLMAAEQSAGFDLTRAPLVRFTLARRADRLHHLVFTGHHAVLDGWSDTLLLSDLWSRYAGEVTGRAPADTEAPPPFRRYVEWTARQDPAEVDETWGALLGHVQRPVLLGELADRLPPGGSATARASQDFESGEPVVKRRLTARVSDALDAFGRLHRLTLSTLAYGAWALVLADLSGARDVVFGVTVSGRSAPVAGLAAMVGPLATTLPLPVRIPSAGDRITFLRGVQSLALDVRRHEHHPLARAVRMSNIPPGRPLFDTAVAVQNAPVLLDLPLPATGLRVVRGPSGGRNSFTVSLEILPTSPLTLRARYDPAVVSAGAAGRLVTATADLIARLVEPDPDAWRKGAPLRGRTSSE